MIKITIQSVSGADYFKFKEAPAEFFDSKAKCYELSRNAGINEDSENLLVSARNVTNRDYLFSNVAVESIEVDGQVYSSFEDLADVLAPILFKKGGGTGGGGTGSVTVTAPLTGNGNSTPLSINPATSSNRGTMSVAHYNKLENVDFSTFMLTTHPAYGISSLNITSWNNKISSSEKGQNNGVAPLDNNGLVPAQYLPSYVDDVLEFSTLSAFPSVGETGKIYVAIDTNKTYRWSGTIYTSLDEGIVLGENSATAYRGDRGKIAYDHSQITSGNPHNVTKSDVGLANVDNTSDINKPVSAEQLTALNTKLDRNITTIQYVAGPITFSSTLTIPKIILLTQTSNTTVNAFWSNGERIFYNGIGGTPKELAFISDLLENRVELIGSSTAGTLNVDLNAGRHFDIILNSTTNIVLINMIPSTKSTVLTLSISGAYLATLIGSTIYPSSDIADINKQRKYTIHIEKGGSSPIIYHSLINV